MNSSPVPQCPSVPSLLPSDVPCLGGNSVLSQLCNPYEIVSILGTGLLCFNTDLIFFVLIEGFEFDTTYSVEDCISVHLYIFGSKCQ